MLVLNQNNAQSAVNFRTFGFSDVIGILHAVLCFTFISNVAYFLTSQFVCWFQLLKKNVVIMQVIVDRYTKEKVLPALDKNRFLLPEDLTVAQFLSIIR